MADNIIMTKIKTGLAKNLPLVKSSRHLYFTTDTQELFVDVDEDTRLRIGDIIKVERQADLPSLTAEESNKFYYVKETGQIVTYSGESSSFEPVNNLESFGVTITPEELNELKEKIDNGEIGGGIDFKYNKNGSNLVGMTGGTSNWVDFKTIKEGRINQLTDLPLLDPGINDNNAKDFTLSDLNNYTTEVVFLDRYSTGTILAPPETDPILTTIPTKYFTGWLKYAIGNDIKNGKIDIGEIDGSSFKLSYNPVGTNSFTIGQIPETDRDDGWEYYGDLKEGEVYQKSDMSQMVATDSSLTGLNQYVTELLFLNRGSRSDINGEATTDPKMIALPVDGFVEWLQRSIGNDIKSKKIDIGSVGSGGGISSPITWGDLKNGTNG